MRYRSNGADDSLAEATAMRTVSIALLALLGLFATPAHAQSVQQFYKGRQVTLIVGFNPGGASDPYARIVARHLPKFLPGAPTIVVRNMPGAGSVRAANYLHNDAPKDGSELGLIAASTALEPLFGLRPAHFNSQRFAWLGSANSEPGVCVSWHTTFVATARDLFSRGMIVGASPTTSLDFPLALNAVLGTRLRIRRGYDSTASIMRAMERRAIHGMCGMIYSALQTAHPTWLPENRARLLLQIGLERSDKLPNIPFVMEFAKNEEDRRVLRLLFGWTIMGRPFLAPPDIPEERKLALRRAFDLTMSDSAFRADAAKLWLDISPIRGVTIEQFLQDIYETPHPLVRRAAKILAQGR
jgi:tripartite-type tricarboxylate transporter receptor subunit TctC